MKKLYLTWSDLDVMKKSTGQTPNGLSGHIQLVTDQVRFGPLPVMGQLQRAKESISKSTFRSFVRLSKWSLLSAPTGGRVFISKNGVSIEPKGRPRKEVIKFIYR